MKNIEITIASDGTAIPSDKAIGHAGEHLATTLYITLPLEWLPQMDYYRLFFKLKSAIYLTEYITATGDKIIYSVPQAAIPAPGTLILQVVGYDSDEENEDGDYKQINKSDNMQFTILESVTGGDLIPGVPKSSLEIAVDEAQQAAAEAAAARDSANQAIGNVQTAIDGALSGTNLRIASMYKEISTLRSALNKINPNNEPKQTVSGTGAVALPVNAVQGQLNVIIKGNTEDGISVSCAMRVVSESADESERTELYISDYRWLRSGGLFNLADNGEDYENWMVDAGISKSAEGLSTSILGYAELPANFKPSTVYTLVYNASIPAGCAIVVQNNLLEVSANLQNGFHKFKFTTRSSITDSNLRLLFGTSGSTVTFALYGVYEGDQTSNPDVDEPRPYGSSVYDEIAYNKQSGQYEKIQRIDDDGKPLPEPVISPISVAGTLIAYPKGTVYTEPVLAVAGVYTDDGISVTDIDFPIDHIDRILKYSENNLWIDVDIEDAVLYPDNTGFEHEDLSDGDIVFFTYYHAVSGTLPELDATYFDSRFVRQDSATGKFYKLDWGVENGDVIPILVEVE